MLTQYLKNKHQLKFQQALADRDPVLLRKAISKGADANAAFAVSAQCQELLPIAHAVHSACPECLKVLFECGAKAPSEDSSQIELQRQAVTAEQQPLALLTLLLDNELDANSGDGQLFFDCLELADHNLQLLLITRLMEHGGNINTTNQQQQSVLDLLMIAEQTQLVGSLISAGATLSDNLNELACSEEMKTFARRKQQDLEIQKMLMGH